MTTTSTPPQHPSTAVGAWRQPGAGDHRGPCPALNSLANGGYLPRNGEVTVAQLVDALSERLALPRSMGEPLAKLAMARLGKPGPDGVKTLDLTALVHHGFLEHDASLTRRDARDGDAAEVVPALVDQLLSLSENGRTLTLEDLAAAHQLRMIQSAASGHPVPFKAAALGTIEAALLFQLLRQGDGIPLADAEELLRTERLPYRVPLQKLGWGSLVITVVRLAVMGNVPFLRAPQRARRAENESLATRARPAEEVKAARDAADRCHPPAAGEHVTS
jgi:Peroxidase, family 2